MQLMKIRYSEFFEIEQVGRAAVVQLQSPTILDTDVVSDVMEDLYRLVEVHGMADLLVDMAQVRFLSSGALGALVALQRRVTTAAGRVVLTGLDERMAWLFRVTRLDTLFAIYPDMEQALKAMHGAWLLPEQVPHRFEQVGRRDRLSQQTV